MKQDRQQVGRGREGLPSSLDRLLLRVVDLGLAGVIFVAPLFLGGRHPLGKLVLVSLICVTALAWLARQSTRRESRWTRTAADWLLLAGAVLLLFQLMPLPQGLWHRVTPHAAELLPLWDSQAEAAGQLGEWSRISLIPHATAESLVMYLAYGMLFLVIVQRIQTLADVRHLMKGMALAAIGMAALGLAQLLFGNGKFLWIYEDPARDTNGVVRGVFYNQNHFAHFLALGIGPLMWWLGSGLAPGRRARSSAWVDRLGGHASRQALLLGVALGVVFVAGLLTFSRSGSLASRRFDSYYCRSTSISTMSGRPLSMGVTKFPSPTQDLFRIGPDSPALIFQVSIVIVVGDAVSDGGQTSGLKGVTVSDPPTTTSS